MHGCDLGMKDGVSYWDLVKYEVFAALISLVIRPPR